jgi:hypothetical protein
MSAFDLKASQENARRRLRSAVRTSWRRPRSDRGKPRIDSRVLSWLVEETAGYDRPPIAEVLGRITERCRTEGLDPPSRATVYKLLDTLSTARYRLAELPPAVRTALYNLGPEGDVPGHQLAFYCFNYGDLAAVSFAAGLPWLALHQARRLPGYRAKSRGLLEAVAQVRAI